MPEQLIVNVTSYETRVASMEAGGVTEVAIERHRDRGIVGNVYLGKVQRVLPGMQAAFVEIGLDKAAFLYVADVVTEASLEKAREEARERAKAEADSGADDGDSDAGDGDVDAATGDVPSSDGPSSDSGESEGSAKNRRRRRARGRSDAKIEQLLRPGQRILVQVAKDAIGTKGPRVTCHISLPGRHLVFMPTHDHVGISRRITDEEERARLRETLHALKPEGGGFVVRTVSAGLSEDKLKEDVDFLVSLWADVKARAEGSEAPALVQPELDLVERIARDSFTDDVNAFIVDDDETFERLKRFMALRDPSLVSRIAMHDEPEPVFEHHGVETELQRAMGRRVWLKSGGYLVIDQAEALTAIDVNTGRFVGKRNLEETILKTNLEAVKEVAYQLRLRNIGGMAIIDFIDMEVPEHRERVLTELEEALKGDKARCNVVKMSELGLVEMTRQRTRESLGRQLTETCWYCEGRGHLKSKRTLVYEIFRSLERQAARFSEPVVVVHAHPEVVDVIYDEEPVALGEIETKLDKRVIVRPRGSFHQEQYDIFGTSAEAAGGQGQRPRRGGRG